MRVCPSSNHCFSCDGLNDGLLTCLMRFYLLYTRTVCDLSLLAKCGSQKHAAFRAMHESLVLITTALSAASIVCFLIATPALRMQVLSQ